MPTHPVLVGGECSVANIWRWVHGGSDARRLLTAALELFAKRGYDGTSVSEIAARAGVTEMTFFRHFRAKASLLVDDPYDPVIGAAIRRQPAGLDPITRAARGIRSAWRQLPPPSVEEVRVRLRIVAQTRRCERASPAGRPRPRQ